MILAPRSETAKFAAREIGEHARLKDDKPIREQLCAAEQTSVVRRFMAYYVFSKHGRRKYTVESCSPDWLPYGPALRRGDNAYHATLLSPEHIVAFRTDSFREYPLFEGTLFALSILRFDVRHLPGDRCQFRQRRAHSRPCGSTGG